MKYKLPFFLLLSQIALAQNSTVVTQFNTGQVFTCIEVDTNNNTVWAGTNKKGLFVFPKKETENSGSFVLANTTPLGNAIYDVSKFVIQSLKADKQNNLWVGHAGLGGTANTNGGIDVFNTSTQAHVKHILQERNAECLTSYVENDGLATNNTQSIAIDENNTVWVASDYSKFLANQPEETTTPGSLSFKRIYQSKFKAKSTWKDLLEGKEASELPMPAFTCLAKTRTEDMGGLAGLRTCKSVACGKSEVWVSVYSYKYATSRGFKQVSFDALSNTSVSSFNYALTTANSPAKILVYDLHGEYKKQIDFSTIGVTANGVFNSICFTKNVLSKNENVWVGLSPRLGFAARINGCWTVLNASNLPGIFLADANVNANAIWSNRTGQVFIGTTKGLIVYNGVGKVDDPASYELYTISSKNMTSDNILGGANDRDSLQWVATDNGISLIKSKVNFTLDKDYTSCKDPHINDIENQQRIDLSNRKDYHSYQIETEICDKNGPNGGNCNARYVYELMKSNASFQAVSPKVFPHDNLKMLLLKEVTDAEKKEIISNVNAWTKNRSGNEFGGIKYIRQVLSPAMILKYYCKLVTNPLCFFSNENCKTTNNFLFCLGDGKIPFGEKLFGLESREYYQAEQEKHNPFKVEACSAYKLYNGPNLMVDRAMFKSLDFLFCNNKLKDSKFDYVKIFPDDQNLTITNYTMVGHFLDPGMVKRFVIEECGKVKVVTVGTGLNYCAVAELPNEITEAQRLALNQIYGTFYGPFPSLVLTKIQKAYLSKIAGLLAKQNGNGNTILGPIIFKNVDLLLQQGFENSK
jgi:hypothetical protein